MRTATLLVASLAFAGAAHAQKACSKADEAAAGKAIDRIASWATLNATWKTYRHCDTGAVGEQFTEALLRLVIDWKNVNQLADAMAKEADYKAFVIAHLKSKEAEADATDVYSRTKSNCPKGLDAFCKEIGSAVREAPEPPPPKAAPAPPPAALPPATAPQPGVPTPSSSSPPAPEKK
ncbi:hypothetical protein BWI17_07760 [Betaproteobacteria bacterium GR16-43]|nr:hypothetical protein BWI17_07760 [Betaproteobacteria bacterium GR16-43]